MSFHSPATSQPAPCKFFCAANMPALKEFLSKELTSARNPEMRARNQYNNHPAVKQHVPAVMWKFAAKEEKTFHLHLPCSFVFFIEGLMLNPLQSVVCKGKSRICVDCTNASHGANSPGSPNTWIPSPSVENPDECPPVYYGDAFQQFIRQIWQLRITYPQVPLRQHVDDIDSAFSTHPLSSKFGSCICLCLQGLSHCSRRSGVWFLFSTFFLQSIFGSSCLRCNLWQLVNLSASSHS